MFKYIINRLTERSTWLGLIGLITACGASLETALAEQIIAAGMAAGLTRGGTWPSSGVPHGGG